MNRFIWLLAVFAAIGARPFLSTASADLFGSGVNEFEIDFVRIGSPGNLPDANPNPAGAVAYEYRIGKYEVSEQMIEKANALGGLGITMDSRGPDFPATSVTWYEAARFVNWLNDSEGHPVAYKFDNGGNFELWALGDSEFNPANPYRSDLAYYFLPSLDEWHKAAYYDPVAGVYYDYPTGSDAVPDGIDFMGDTVFDAVFFDGAFNPNPNNVTDVGVLSTYGTAGQGGNVSEWLETASNRINNSDAEHRGRVGGSWVDGSTLLAAWNPNSAAPLNEQFFVGFRIASIVPEPTAFVLLGATLFFLAGLRVQRFGSMSP